MGLARFGWKTPCRGLVWDEKVGRYWCSLIREAKDAEELKVELSIGAGCCCSLNTDRAMVAAGRKPGGRDAG